MRGVGRGLAPIRDAYSGGVAYDRETLDVHRRQIAAMRRRDDGALDEVLDEHFRMLETQFAKGIGRRWSDLFGPRASRRPRLIALRPATSAVTARGSASKTACVDVAEVLAVDLAAAAGASQRTTMRSTSWRTIRPCRGRAPRSEREPEPREVAGADGGRRDEVEAEVERRAARDRIARRPGVGVRVAVRDERERCAADALDLEGSGKRPRRDDERAETASRTKATSPGRRPSSRRPRASIRRTSSASNPTPALKANRRPLTRPSPIGRRAPRARPRARRRDRAPSPSARGRTLVPPPGRNPSGTALVTPFSTSL